MATMDFTTKPLTPRGLFGRAGNRTQDLSHARKHAKRTLYQLSHTPLCLVVSLRSLEGYDGFSVCPWFNALLINWFTTSLVPGWKVWL